MTRARWVVAVAVSLLALANSLSPTVHGTSALFSASTVAGTLGTAGGTFTPSTAPRVSRSVHGVHVTLTWARVQFSSGATVSYVVTRIDPDGTSRIICAGPDSPVVSGGSVTCTDKKPSAGSLYSEQPVLFVAGTATWALAPSTPA